MELVTGHAGSNHISAADMASMYRGILTDDDCVLASGDKLSCTMLDSNTAEIGTGDCFIQAHHCRVDVAEQLTVESGSAGYKRNDLVVIRYTLGDGNVQDVYLTVVKGTATVGTPSDPTLTEGDIDGGAVLAEFALWRIPIDGITVGTPVRVMPCVDTLQDQVDTLRESVSWAYFTKSSTSGFVQYSDARITSSTRVLLQMAYTTGGIAYQPHVQPQAGYINIYLRNGTAVPPDGTEFKFNALFNFA